MRGPHWPQIPEDIFCMRIFLARIHTSTYIDIHLVGVWERKRFCVWIRLSHQSNFLLRGSYCTHVHITYIYQCMYICVYVRTYVSINQHTVYRSSCTYVCMFIYLCTYVRTYVCIRVLIYAYECIQLCLYKNIIIKYRTYSVIMSSLFVHTHSHTHTHTHTHTGGNQDNRDWEDQGGIRKEELTPRGSTHAKTETPEHNPLVRDDEDQHSVLSGHRDRRRWRVVVACEKRLQGQEAPGSQRS